MSKSRPSNKSAPIRLQGTDGIRREVRPQSDFKNLSPQDVFLQRNIITEEFMERYAFCHVQLLIRQKKAKAGDGFVVGWDPRDTQGLFNDAVVRGIRKAGGNAWVLGRVPTPLVPMFILARGAKGGFMVTASHNPKDQNGVKIFLAYRGLKMLPENDIELSREVLRQGSLKTARKLGRQIDRRPEGLGLFKEFMENPMNSWSDGLSFDSICLVVDPARGTLCGIAADIFREAGFGEVHEINAKLDGKVNHLSGVADLEGTSFIDASMIEAGGLFHRHPAILKLFELGRNHRRKAKNGKIRIAGAIFDADGDRFYRVDYHPEKDGLIVLDGDQTAYWQARFLATKHPRSHRGNLYLHTVESDLNISTAVSALGLKPGITPVGDKWILWRIIQLILDTRFKTVEHRVRTQGRVRLKHAMAQLKKRWNAFKKSGKLNSTPLSEFEQELDQIVGNLSRMSTRSLAVDSFSFAVGSEETGHNITTGWLETEPNLFQTVHCGNGLKSAINTFAATEHLLSGKAPTSYYSQLEKPFSPGHKSTLYVYYIDQSRFVPGSRVWQEVKKCLTRVSHEKGYRTRTVSFQEDPEMLYLELKEPEGRGKAAVFVRNSGTENKISVNLRGRKKDARVLESLGQAASRVLLELMKDRENPLYAIELKLLNRLRDEGPVAGDGLGRKDLHHRVIQEMFKQRLAAPSSEGIQLTSQGRWYLNHLK